MQRGEGTQVLKIVSQRLSLRPPQARSLDILADTLERIELRKGADPAAALAAIGEAYPQVEAFERDFPSLCFALATGVGKTRLMGAFVSYLYLTGRSRHFFVLAPNRTIYEKLIGDFSPESPKYVFRGIAEFAQLPPLVVTGDNYETGRGVRLEGGRSADLFGSGVHVNIFNIDKINKEESPRGKPKMKRLQETIGESYYAYLAKLDDLVLLMDEAHRYRASAGARAIDGLRPILGLELTATPKSVGSSPVPFRNVIYSYGLGDAMADGFVKEPAVATRANFDPKAVPAERLERIKLEDAVHYHDHVAVELDRYHRVSGRPKVHPFILVVAQDTAHARDLKALIEADDFFKGRFKGKVAEVHSALRGEETEEATQRLVALEQDNRTEIVIHVNKLTEGWDVTNLYTIVPLRASASDILTEQTLGRGLRLPYGQRVSKGDDDEFSAVDRLTVIAHDRFDELISRAKEQGSIVLKTLTIGEGGDIPAAAPELIEVRSTADEALRQRFKSNEEQQVLDVVYEVIGRYERKLGGLDGLRDAEVQYRIAEEVGEILKPVQGVLDGVVIAPNVKAIVEAATEEVVEKTIPIPQIVVLPKRQVTFHFANFELKNLEAINVRPIDDALLIQNLRTEARFYLAKAIDDPREERMEDYLVRHLIDQNEIDYDAHADLLYGLAAQVVARVRSYLETDAEVENVLLRNGKYLAEFIFAQMMQHYRETPLDADDYEVRVTKGFTVLKPQPLHGTRGQVPRDFRQPVSPPSDTKRQIFFGFRKCCYSRQKFHSDPERRFAVLLEGEASVEKWLKPGRGQFQIDYRSGENYEPDFVVETTDGMLICEVKARADLDDAVVKAKASAATKWCQAANENTVPSGGKFWRYLLIPDDQITGNATLSGLASRFSS